MATTAWGRLGISVGLASFALGLAHIPLNGVDRDALRGLGADPVYASVGMLGVMPVLSAFVTVEVVTLLKARWRKRRTSGAEGRAPLTRIANGLAIVLALFQAYGVALHLEGLGVWATPVVAEPGWAFRLFTMLTAGAATALLIVVAAAIRRFGIGNGYSVLIASALCLRIARGLAGAVEHGREAMLAAVVTVVAVSFVIARLVPPRGAMADPTPAGPYRTAPAAAHLPFIRPLPCGIIPLAATASALSIPAALGNADLAARLAPGTETLEVTGIVLILCLVALFSWAFHAPQRVAALRARLLGPGAPGSDADEVRQRLVPHAIVAALLLVGLWWLQSWMYRAGALGLSPLDAALLAAIVLDLMHEMRTRLTHGSATPVAELHRVYALDVALELLARHEIRAEPRSHYFRGLLQFFGPYVPIEILVAEKDAKRARKIVAKLGKAKRPRRARN